MSKARKPKPPLLYWKKIDYLLMICLASSSLNPQFLCQWNEDEQRKQ